MKALILSFLVCGLSGCAVVRPATAFPDYFRHEGRTLLLPFACVLVTDGEAEFIVPADAPRKKKERIVAEVPKDYPITIAHSRYRRALAKISFFFECRAEIAGTRHEFILDASWPSNRRIYEEGPNSEGSTQPLLPTLTAEASDSPPSAHFRP